MNAVAMNRLRRHYGMRPMGFGAPSPLGITGWRFVITYDGSTAAAMALKATAGPDVANEANLVYTSETWPLPGLDVPYGSTMYKFVTDGAAPNKNVYIYSQPIAATAP